MFKSIFEFLRSKVFLRNFIIYIIVILGLIWGVLSWLDAYTNHGKFIKVPNFKGVPVTELKEFCSKNNVGFLVIDSIFDAKTPPGVVIKQEPEADAEVKEGREIYLYVSASSPPEIVMPKLVDKSLRQAISMINSFGFRLGKIEFVEDECTNCVVEQRINGKTIAPGVVVSKGNAIDIIAGKGTRAITVHMPCLYGLTKYEAMLKLSESSLAVGKSFFDNGKDIPEAKVYKQLPDCIEKDEIDIGSTIDVFLTTSYGKIPKIPVDSLINTKSEDEDFDK